MKAVIFDWDGTLVDSKEVIVEAYKKVLNESGYDINADFIIKRIGIGTAKTFIDFFDEKRIPYDTEMIKRFSDRKYNIHLGLSDRIKLLDGVIELLNSLEGKVRIVLASMCNKSIIQHVLNSNGLEKYFDVIVTGDDVKKPKPDPSIFLNAADRLNIQPKDCIVIEDSTYGIVAAKKANMKCIAVASGNFSREQLEKESPDFVVKSLRELNYEIIMNLFNIGS